MIKTGLLIYKLGLMTAKDIKSAMVVFDLMLKQFGSVSFSNSVQMKGL
jgi:hypothetical protein